LARRNNSTTKISNTSEHIDKNDNPDRSSTIQAAVATTMMPKETFARFHNRISAAKRKMREVENKVEVKQYQL
jgi:hypothetical protein